MSVELPPLPEPHINNVPQLEDENWHGYTADQMRAYARSAVDSALEAAAKACEARGAAYRNTRAPGWHEVDHESAQCAAAIRAMRSGVEHI